MEAEDGLSRMGALLGGRLIAPGDMGSNLKRRFINFLAIRDPDLRRAVSKVRRGDFVPPQSRHLAYADAPLPIGFGQTISQPRLVVQMIEMLELKPGDRLLEIGTGSGYQTALLAELGFVDVYSVELIPALARQAATRLRDLGYDQVHLRQGDGFLGWPEHAPYQAIIVTAAARQLPDALADQLDEGGRLVIPIGPAFGWQTLWRLIKQAGELVGQDMGAVAFVPLLHETDRQANVA